MIAAYCLPVAEKRIMGCDDSLDGDDLPDAFCGSGGYRVGKNLKEQGLDHSLHGEKTYNRRDGRAA